MRSFYIFICFVCLAVSTASSQMSLEEVLERFNSGSIPYISVEETRMLQLQDKTLLLDAREMKEFEVSKIPTAIYVGYSEFSSKVVSEKIKSKDSPIIVYCSLGVRSEVVGEKLRKAGFTNVKNLYGGIIEWKNQGFPVFDGQNNETEKVHTSSKYWSKWLKKGEKVYR